MKNYDINQFSEKSDVTLKIDYLYLGKLAPLKGTPDIQDETGKVGVSLSINGNEEAYNIFNMKDNK